MGKNNSTQDSILFNVTPEMVDDFAQLTGDYNPLHLDSEYARRTSHRQCTVHGLLPVSFLAASASFKNAHHASFIKGITANFIQPIYANQKLRLIVNWPRGETPSPDLKINYSIESAMAGLPLTTGFVLLSQNQDERKKLSMLPCKEGKIFSLPSNPVSENYFQFEHIKNGQQEDIAFSIRNGAINCFQRLLAKGLNRASCPKTANISLNNFLATLMCSTLVGMRLPGRRATFLNLALTFDTNCPTNQVQMVRGIIDFKSRSAPILIEKVSFHAYNTF